jgi:hypothetical protein
VPSSNHRDRDHSFNRQHKLDGRLWSFRDRARKIRTSVAGRRNRLYVKYERLRARVLPEKRLHILMSDFPDWEGCIRDGFCRSRHQVEFGPISRASFEKFDLVVPLKIEDLVLVSRWPELAAKNPLPLPSEESVLLCDDKLRFNETLIQKGFGSYIPRMGAALDPPYILKERVGAWGQGCSMIYSREDESGVSDKLNDPRFFRQEIIGGSREFATHVLFAKGQIVKSLNLMFEFGGQSSIKGKEREFYKVIHRCPYLNLFAKILRAIDFQGLCCVNYKVCCGRPYILEINPRFGGSLSPYFFSFIRHLNTAPHSFDPKLDAA